MSYEWIGALKPGDDVLICDNSRWYPCDYRAAKVTKVNSRFIETERGAKFSARHGREYGHSGYSQCSSIENPADPEIQRRRSEANEERARQRTCNAACSLWDRIYRVRNRLSAEQLNSIAAVLQPIADAVAPIKSEAA